ncbi:(R)-mandelonitrile lyase [Noviherbaspirillum sp.]|uniref:(R)-mandelonitrile lyase n=1 Tax=Noviherbaspirillum sp. TaxID=1926288 RepID=UPI002FE29D98
MKALVVPLLPICLLSANVAHGQSTSAGSAASADASAKQSQAIMRAGSQASSKGPAEYVTGNVHVSPLFPANPSTPVSGHHVSFEPGARSAWHTHPAGQHLIVTAGKGWTQEWGGSITEIRKGDVVWCPPGVKHWHGASPTSALTHISLTGTVNGKNVEWLEKVSDEQYRQ